MRTATRRATVYGGRRGVAAADWWAVPGQTCVAAYKPIGAASLAASYINLANPGTNNAAPGTAPTLGAGGWIGGGGAYLTTGIVMPGSKIWTISVRVSGGTNAEHYFAGAADGGWSRFWIVGNYSNNSAIWRFGGNYKFHAPTMQNGILTLAARDCYRDAVAVGTITDDTNPNMEIYLLAANVSGTPGYHFLGTIAALAIYKPTEPSTTPMSAADVAALTTRMAALA